MNPTAAKPTFDDYIRLIGAIATILFLIAACFALVQVANGQIAGWLLAFLGHLTIAANAALIIWRLPFERALIGAVFVSGIPTVGLALAAALNAVHLQGFFGEPWLDAAVAGLALVSAAGFVRQQHRAARRPDA